MDAFQSMRFFMAVAQNVLATLLRKTCRQDLFTSAPTNQAFARH